jgi:GrpB-like predicted nucleotidyltransferase (UPF0157 family)
MMVADPAAVGAILRAVNEGDTGAGIAAVRPKRRVVVLEYDPEWPRVFDRVRDAVAPALGDVAVAIEHVGSTSVPGLAAKPIVDVDVVVRTASDMPAAIERLATLGYVHRGNLGIPGREAFDKPKEGFLSTASHNMYVCASDAAVLRRHVTFLKYKRTHPHAIEEYAAIKREGARRTPDDRDAYQEFKSPVVQKILDRALAAADAHDSTRQRS